ncbi:hypothetical protein OF83DRAFT_870053 [Amylostereum chailletii]|nr:hypothetical protein OF83DRAFT_870053 [Amylostereum chailletii]
MAGSERQMTSKLHLPPPTIIMAIGLLVSIQDGVLATIFLSTSGFAILIFEWLHLFKDETRLIWKQPFTPSKLVFLYLRYGVLVTHAFLSYGISGIPETISEKLPRMADCHRFYITWDHRPRIIRILNGALAFSFLASFGCCIASLTELYHDIELDNDVYHVCLISHKPSAWVGIWVPQVVFQVFTIGLTLFNAGERPRTSNT